MQQTNRFLVEEEVRFNSILLFKPFTNFVSRWCHSQSSWQKAGGGDNFAQWLRDWGNQNFKGFGAFLQIHYTGFNWELGYNLPAKYVLHTVGPIGVKPPLLKSCYRTTLELAKKYQLRSIVIQFFILFHNCIYVHGKGFMWCINRSLRLSR